MSSPASPLNNNNGLVASLPKESLATLFCSVPISVLCSYLNTADVLAVASVNRSTCQLLLSSPSVWRATVFNCFPAPRLPLPPPSSVPSSSSSALPSWCAVVQAIRVNARAPDCSPHFTSAICAVWSCCHTRTMSICIMIDSISVS